jgi:hypothetical protein
MKKILLLSSLLSASAMAAEVSYTNLNVGYLNGEGDLPGYVTALGLEDDVDLEGFFVSGQYEITNNFFAYASYQDGELQSDFLGGGGSFEVDTRVIEAGLGGYAALGEDVDFYYSAGYKYTTLEVDGFGDQDVGNIDLTVGLRWSIAGWVEVNPYIEQSIGVDDDEFVGSVNTTTAGLNLLVTGIPYVQPFAGISYELDSSDDNIASDLVLYTAGLRFAF